MQTEETNGTAVAASNRLQHFVDLPKLEPKSVEINIVGKTPLIVHNWSSKALKMILDKHMGKAKEGKQPKDPFEEFKSSLYPLEDGSGYGMPAPAFKAAAVTAGNDVDMAMTMLRRAFHVSWYTVPIIGTAIKSPIRPEDHEYAKQLKPYHALGISMRCDPVRNQTGVVDLRFRAWYPQWKATILVEYNPHVISLDQLVNLFRAAGDAGIGEWRPSSPKCKSGEFGRFTVAVA